MAHQYTDMEKKKIRTIHTSCIQGGGGIGRPPGPIIGGGYIAGYIGGINGGGNGCCSSMV